MQVLANRKGAELGSAPAFASRSLEGSRFAAQLEWALRRLSVTRMRISLARLTLPESCLDRAAALAEAVDDPCALVGAMPDGSIVAAFLGPRPYGSAGDRSAAARILGQISDAARRIGLDGLDDPTLKARLAFVHRWTDEIIDVPSTLTDLMLLAGSSGRSG